MAATKRTRAERERDYAIVAELHCQGQTQTVMAERIGVSQQQISLDLKVVEERWRKAAIGDVDAVRGRELAKIDHLERTYWASWLRSLEEKQITSTKRRGGLRLVGKAEKEQTTTEASLRKEQRDGNPAYLSGIQWCIERRCKIWGLDAPVKIDITERIRQLAAESGLDPDDAVREAERVLAATR